MTVLLKKTFLIFLEQDIFESWVKDSQMQPETKSLYLQQYQNIRKDMTFLLELDTDDISDTSLRLKNINERTDRMSSEMDIEHPKARLAELSRQASYENNCSTQVPPSSLSCFDIDTYFVCEKSSLEEHSSNFLKQNFLDPEEYRFQLDRGIKDLYDACNGDIMGYLQLEN